jgi:hypothetical protein
MCNSPKLAPKLPMIKQLFIFKNQDGEEVNREEQSERAVTSCQVV